MKVALHYIICYCIRNYTSLKILQISEKLYSEPSVKLPTLPQLEEIASKLNINVADEDLKEYQTVMKAFCDGYSSLDKLNEPGLPVKYPRTPGQPPKPEENKLNGW